MKGKKLQVFISSTYTDLIEERQAAVEAILSSGHIPAGMELFSAGDESQMTVIERWIDESDVYLLILGGRYGSIDKKTGKSYTQLEYEYANQKSKPLFAVVISEKTLEEKIKLKGSSVMEQENPKELKAFKELVKGNLIKFWDDTKDIKLAMHETISEFLYRKELVGWIRGDNSINTGLLAEEIARVTKENSELRNKVENDGGALMRYAGLAYDDMKHLLETQFFKSEGVPEVALFDFIIQKGEVLSMGYSPLKFEWAILDRLVVFKLVTKTNVSSVAGLSKIYYTFTDDGQHFYIKSVSLQKI